MEAVLAVVYLIFNEGYAASEGPDLLRNDLVDSAIRLGRVLVELMPADAEAWALLALMELQASRGPARTSADGELVLLEDQDRRLWDRELIALGRAHLGVAARLGPPGSLHLQAGIAACHAEAPTFAATDWTRIVSLYDALFAREPSPVIALNRAVAVAMAEGPAPGARAGRRAPRRRTAGRRRTARRRSAPTSCAASGARRKPPPSSRAPRRWRATNANAATSRATRAGLRRAPSHGVPRPAPSPPRTPESR